MPVVYTLGESSSRSKISVLELARGVYRTVVRELEEISLHHLSLPVRGDAEFVETVSYVLLKLLQREYGSVIDRVSVRSVGDGFLLEPTQRVLRGPLTVFDRDYGKNDDYEEWLGQHREQTLSEYLYLPDQELNYWLRKLDAQALQGLFPVCKTPADPRLLWCLSLGEVEERYDLPLTRTPLSEEAEMALTSQLRDLVARGAVVVEGRHPDSLVRLDNASFSVLLSPHGESWLRESLVNDDFLIPYVSTSPEVVSVDPEKLALAQSERGGISLNSHVALVSRAYAETVRSEPRPIPPGRYVERVNNILEAVAKRLAYESLTGSRYHCVDAAEEWWVVGRERPPLVRDYYSVAVTSLGETPGADTPEELRRLITRDGEVSPEFLD